MASATIGVADTARTKAFYDAVLKPLGYACLSRSGSILGYGASGVELWTVETESPVPANMRSGLHFCFAAPDRAGVDAFHAAALESGGQDNGAPGLRQEYNSTYYAAFVIDPDGYRLEAYCSKPE